MTLYSDANRSRWLPKVEKQWLVSKWWQISLKKENDYLKPAQSSEINPNTSAQDFR